MDLSSSSVSENSSGSQQLLDGGLPSLSVSLSIQPSSLEQRYWWVPAFAAVRAYTIDVESLGYM